ncbi:MAG: tRNA (cytidine(34)-2'-O)-methyltransferase [Deferribacterota bacterium]|nr:tRNA (cytidine(34)-2'-O)-methyltransferase [Deferribacterota bacterium]
MKVVLFNPLIPQNTGNIIRLCACTDIKLILIGPLGFSLNNKYLKRASLDYRDLAVVEFIENKDSFFEKYKQDDYQYAFLSTKGGKYYNQIPLCSNKENLLIFGNEDVGLPEDIYNDFSNTLYRIPMKKNIRCLNLSNAVAIVVYSLLEKSSFYGFC